MVRIALSTASVHLAEALGRPRYELAGEGKHVVKVAGEPAPTLDLLDVPATLAAHGIHTADLCIQHIPAIDAGYLAELRAAFDDAGVEIYQLLIDLGDVSSPDPQIRAADMAMTKRWIEIASEVGAGGVRYVPGDSEPSPETLHLAGEAFRELADYAIQWGIKPATENYKTMNQQAPNLLAIVDHANREYGVIADFGNARGPDKFDTLAQLLPHATSIHAWAEYDEAGTLNREEFRHCLTMARDNGFDGPIMLLGGLPTAIYKAKRDFWGGIDELRQEVSALFDL